jgi:hypothetical protein
MDLTDIHRILFSVAHETFSKIDQVSGIKLKISNKRNN